jgi:hypothetical protein
MSEPTAGARRPTLAATVRTACVALSLLAALVGGRAGALAAEGGAPPVAPPPAAPPPAAAVDVRTVSLATAPAHAIVLAGRPDRIGLDRRICAISGAPWARVDQNPQVVVVAAESFAPGWIELEVTRPGGTCGEPLPVRIYVVGAAPLPAPPPDATATLQAESHVAEVRAADLSAYQLAAVENGIVTGATPCLGTRACAVPVERGFVRDWLRGAPVGLVLWPAAVPLAAGDELPAQPDGAGGWRGWRDLAVTDVQVVFQRPLVAVEELNVAAERATLPLFAPEAVADVRCTRARCSLSPQGVEVFGVEPTALSVTVRLDLVAGAVRRQDGNTLTRETLEIPLVRCALQPVAPVPLLAGAANHRYLLAIGRECAVGRTGELQVETRPPTFAWVRSELPGTGDEAWRTYEVVFDSVPEGIRSLDVTVARKDLGRTSLGRLSIPVEGGYRPVSVSFDVEDLGFIDFVPSNRDARIALGYVDDRWERDIQVQDRRGYYRVRRTDPRSATIRAMPDARGAVALRLAYVPEALTRVLGRPEPLAVFETEARYPLQQLNIPLAITPRDGEGPRFVRVVCTVEGEDVTVAPGRAFSVPYAERDGCRVVIDRQAIPEAAGAQHLRVKAGDREVMLTVAHRVGNVTVALPGADKDEFAKLVVTVGHDYAGGHYALAPRHDVGPEARWTIVLGDRIFRISASTAVPTGLFRFGFDGARGSLPLSAGITTRFVFLYKEGREIPLGLEIGLLGTSLSDTPHLSVVAGLGLSIPVLNENTALQTSFNIHAWAEYSPTRDADGESPWAFLFGPSFTVGKFSTTL